MRSSKLMPLPEVPQPVRKRAALLDGSFPQNDPDSELNSGVAHLQKPTPFADFLNSPVYRGTGLKTPQTYQAAGFSTMSLQELLAALTPTDLDTDSP